MREGRTTRAMKLISHDAMFYGRVETRSGARDRTPSYHSLVCGRIPACPPGVSFVLLTVPAHGRLPAAFVPGACCTAVRSRRGWLRQSGWRNEDCRSVFLES